MNPPSFPLRLWRRLRDRLLYRLFDHRRLPLRDRFAAVHQGGQWSGWGGRFPISGEGSSLEATAGLRDGLFRALITVCPDRDLLRIVDAGCGDMTWMPELLARLATYYAQIDYLGIDIVPALVAANRVAVPPAANVTLRFDCLDVTRDPVPAGNVVFCRDLLNHLCNADIARALENLNRSPCRYAVLTSNSGHPNTELALSSPGASRNVDLEAPPFSLPPPLIRGEGDPALWRLPLWKR